jgi:hypothetical protein
MASTMRNLLAISNAQTTELALAEYHHRQSSERLEALRGKVEATAAQRGILTEVWHALIVQWKAADLCARRTSVPNDNPRI